MLFGVLCTYVMAYGTLTLFGGIASIFNPRTLVRVVVHVTKQTEELRTDLNLRHGEGVFDISKKITLAEIYPPFLEFDDDELRAVLHRVYWLTSEEEKELHAMLSPIEAFDNWAAYYRLSSGVRAVLRKRLVGPVLYYLSRIPDER